MRKILVTFAALKLLLPSVNHHMTFKMVILCESLVILAALIWYLHRVYHMTLKSTIIWEGLVTLSTMIWFQLWIMWLCFVSKDTPHRLHWYVFSTVCDYYETNSCHICYIKWILPCVNRYMTFKMAILCESLVTLAALIWFLTSVCVLRWIIR